MHTLFVAALRLFILLDIFHEVFSIFTYINYGLSSPHTDLWSVFEMVTPLIVTFLLLLLVFWKAPWIADRMKFKSTELSNLSISAETIIAAGIILFGIYGIADQLIHSLGYFSYHFGGQFTTPGSQYSSGMTIWTAVFLILKLLIYFYCVVSASRIANIATKKIGSLKVNHTE